MRWLWTAVPGVCIVAFAFREIFQDLFHPAQSGSFSDYVGRTLFRLLRRRPSILSLAGPLTLVIVILSWALLQAVGFALIYWLGFPRDFRIDPADQAGAAHGFWIVLHFSFDAMTTVGMGDVMPKANWLRMLASFQSLVGFALLTASVSSIVLIYPALARLRTLARLTSTLARAEKQTGVTVISSNADNLLNELALAVIQTRVDFIHFPIIYYFHSDHPRSSLPHVLPYLLQLAENGLKADASDRVRLAASTLYSALNDLAQILSDRFIDAEPDDVTAVFQAYTNDHVIADREE